MPSAEESESATSVKAGKASKEKDAKVAGKSKEKEKEKEKERRKETKEPVNGKEAVKEKSKAKEKEVVREKEKGKDKDKPDKAKAKEKEEKPKEVKESKEKDKKKEKRSQDEEEEEEEPRKRESSNRRTKERSRKRRDPSSEREDSRSRDRRKRREKSRYRERDRDRIRDKYRQPDRDRSRSRDAGPKSTAKDVKAAVSTSTAAPARPAPPAKTAADLAREKAEFEAFCQAQAAMAERAVQPPAATTDPLAGSMVLALGNFGGRAAGQGAPGQNDQISLFCRASGVDQRAEISLRGLPVHLAAEIMAQGPILGVNSSAVLMARIHKAEQISRNRNLSLGNTAAVQAAHASGDIVTAFIAQYGVDASAEGALRALPMEAQRQVIGEGPLRGLNASALLMSRVRRVQGSLAASAAYPMGPGMNPLSAKIAL